MGYDGYGLGGFSADRESEQSPLPTADEFFGSPEPSPTPQYTPEVPQQLPTADEFFGPADQSAAPTEPNLPTADEFFGPKRTGFTGALQYVWEAGPAALRKTVSETARALHGGDPADVVDQNQGVLDSMIRWGDAGQQPDVSTYDLDSTWVKGAKGTMDSLGSSVSTLPYSIAGGMAGGEAGAAAGTLIGGPAGAAIGGGAGLFLGGMAGGFVPIKRAEEMRFLEDVRDKLIEDAKAQGKTLSNEELTAKLIQVKDLAERSGWAEAGFESGEEPFKMAAAGMGGKQLQSYLGKAFPGVLKVAAPLAAGAATSILGETGTDMVQRPAQEEAYRRLGLSGSPAPGQGYSEMPFMDRAVESFKEVAPSTIGLELLMGGAHSAVGLGRQYMGRKDAPQVAPQADANNLGDILNQAQTQDNQRGYEQAQAEDAFQAIQGQEQAALPGSSAIAQHVAQGGGLDLLSGKPSGYGLGSAETFNALTPEEQARADAIRQERETPPPALPQGQGFELVGAPQNFSQAEAAAVEASGIPAMDENALTAPMPPEDRANMDAGNLKSEADLIRDYQAQALAEAGARGNDLLKYINGRLSAKSISDHFGTAVTQDLRGRLGNWAFRSEKSGGVPFDVLEAEAKSQGLLAPDESLIDTLQNIRPKFDRINQDASRGIINGQTEADGYAAPLGSARMEPEALPSDRMPIPEADGLRPVNSDETLRDGQEPSYLRQTEPSSPETDRQPLHPDVAQAVIDSIRAKFPEANLTLARTPRDLHPFTRTAIVNGDASAAYIDGKSYIYAPKMTSEADVFASGMHELTHQGIDNLRNVASERLGKGVLTGRQAVNNVLDQAWMAREKEISALAEKGAPYEDKFDLKTEKGQRKLTEEWLANLGETDNSRWHDRYVAAMTRFFRSVAESLGLKVKWTDAETRDFLRQARDTMKAHPEQAGVGALKLAYQRAQEVTTATQPPAVQQATPSSLEQARARLSQQPQYRISLSPFQQSFMAGSAAKTDRDPMRLSGILRTLFVDDTAAALDIAKKAGGKATAEQLDMQARRRAGVHGIVYDMIAEDGAGVSNYGIMGRETEVHSGSKTLAQHLEFLKGKPQEFADWGSYTVGLRYIALNDRNVRNRAAIAKLKTEMADIRKDIKTENDHKRRVQLTKLHKAKATEAKELAKTIVKDIPLAESQAEVARVKATYSQQDMAEFEKARKGFVQWYRQAQLKPLHDIGALSTEAYNAMLNAPESEFYVKLAREMDALDGGSSFIGSSTVHRIKGSKRKTIHPVESAIADITRTVKFVEQQKTNKLFVELRNNSPEMAEIIKPVKGGQAMPTSRDHITTYENGVKKVWAVPWEVALGLNGLPPVVSKVWQYVTLVPRTLATGVRWGTTMLSPVFAARNTTRDQFTAHTLSQYGYFVPRDFSRGLAEWATDVMGKKSDLVSEWRRAGGETGVYTALERSAVEATKENIFNLKPRTLAGQTVKLATTPARAIMLMSEGSEKATRLGLYANARKKGATPGQGMMESRDTTVDFSRAGVVGRMLNQIIPFWNANVQGVSKMGRGMTTGRFYVNAALGIMAPALALWALHRDDDWYKELQPWEKDFYLHFKVPGGPIVRLPIAFETGILFGALPIRVLEWLGKDDPQGLKDVAKAIKDALIPPLGMPGITQFIEDKANHSFFRDRPLESRSMENLPPWLRYGTYTSELAKSAGKLINYSPTKIDNYIRGLTGTLGSDISRALDPVVQTARGNSAPPEVGKNWWEKTPIVSGFTMADPIGSGSESVNRFYDTLAAATQAKAGLKVLVVAKDKAGVQEFKQNNRAELAAAEFLSAQAQVIGSLRKQIAAVQQSTSMSPDAKRKQVDRLGKQMTEKAARANETFNKLRRKYN